MTATIRETVTSTMQAAGLGRYTQYAEPVIRSLEADPSDPHATIERFLRSNGYTQYAAQGRQVAEAVSALGGTTVSGSPSPAGEGSEQPTPTSGTQMRFPDGSEWTREEAAAILRRHAGEGDIDEADIESALFEAGLIDEPVLDDEEGTDRVMARVDSVLAEIREKVDSLVTFARGYGFRG